MIEQHDLVIWFKFLVFSVQNCETSLFRLNYLLHAHKRKKKEKKSISFLNSMATEVEAFTLVTDGYIHFFFFFFPKEGWGGVIENSPFPLFACTQ